MSNEAKKERSSVHKPCSDFGDGKPGAIATPEEVKKNVKKVAKLATKLAQSEAAKGLPGYKKDKPPQCKPLPPSCGND